MQLFKFYASLYQISFLYSVARMNQPQCVIHDSLVACNLLHDRTTQGTKKSAVIFPCISDNVSSTVKSVIHFECSVQLVARMIQPRYAIHRFPRNVHFDARKIQPRCVPHDFVQQVARYDFRFRASRCTLRFMISCIKMHATIYDFVQRATRDGDYS